MDVNYMFNILFSVMLIIYYLAQCYIIFKNKVLDKCCSNNIRNIRNIRNNHHKTRHRMMSVTPHVSIKLHCRRVHLLKCIFFSNI